jgi:hypothetical protein
MTSLRDTAACIGITGDFSLVSDFFGYLAPPQDLSVLTQIDRLQGRHVHINLIRVGIEAFTPDDEAALDVAVQQTRDIYAQVSLGVGRVLRFSITTADANGRDHIDRDAEAEALTNEWTVPNDAIDVFLVKKLRPRDRAGAGRGALRQGHHRHDGQRRSAVQSDHDQLCDCPYGSALPRPPRPR